MMSCLDALVVSGDRRRPSAALRFITMAPSFQLWRILAKLFELFKRSPT